MAYKFKPEDYDENDRSWGEDSLVNSMIWASALYDQPRFDEAYEKWLYMREKEKDFIENMREILPIAIQIHEQVDNKTHKLYNTAHMLDSA